MTFLLKIFDYTDKYLSIDKPMCKINNLYFSYIFNIKNSNNNIKLETGNMKLK